MEFHDKCETLFHRRKEPGGFFTMDVRRQTALLLLVACCSVALTLPMLWPAPQEPDPLAPLGPLASLANPLAPDPVLMGPLRLEASAALDALQSGGAQP